MHAFHRPLVAAAIALAFGPATAQDMTLTPSTNGAVVIQTPAGTPALAVQPTGAVQLPLLPGSTPATGTPVCHDATNGALQSCDAAAFAGAAGPKGDKGDKGDRGDIGPAGAGTPGATGATGPRGLSTLVATAAEPAGANCATGGTRVQYGLDADDNGVLDASEVNPALTRYVCNGAQGPKGDTGAPGSGGGITGLSEARHGCFAADASVRSGAGYTVTLGNGAYTITFNPALGAGNYSLLVDARTSTGRALAITDSGSPDTGLILTPGWLAADGPETIARICFMLAR